MVGHEVNYKVIRCWYNNNCRKGAGKVVWVGSDGVLLDLLVAGTKLVDGKALVESVFGGVIATHSIDLLELLDGK